MLIDIHFGKDKSYTLTYKIYDTEHGRLFYDRMKSQPNNLISRKEFYGFGETEQDILSELEKGDDVKISSFGTFSVRHKKTRIGRNPKTGIEVPIKERNVVTFSTSNVLKSHFN